MSRSEFIKKFLQKIFDNFIEQDKKYKERGTTPAILTFKDNNIPNYDDKYIQQLYLLRYSYAYFYEYYRYFDIILKNDNYEEINIFSFGCGCGLDFYALEAVIEYTGIQVNKVNYRGVDKTKWQYTPQSKEGTTIKIEYMNINDLAVTDFDKKYDIIIFPKSLGEISKTVSVDKIAELIKHIIKDKATIINSIRESYQSDVDDFNSIISSIIKKESFPEVKDFGEMPIKSGDYTDLNYPDNIKEYLTNMQYNCRSPILRTTHIRYQKVNLRKSKK